MKLFQLSNKSGWGYLQGMSERMLPPVYCPVCKSMTGCSNGNFPCIDVKKIDFEIPGIPVKVEVFAELKRKLQPIYPADFEVQFSQSLGVAIVQAKGRIGDLIGFVGSGLCCFKTEALEKLNQSGITPIQAYPVRFKRKSEWEGKIVEGQIQGHLSLGNATHPDGKMTECPICGRDNLRELQDSRMCIKRSSVPAVGDFFAIKHWADSIIVTERFKSAAENFLNNVAFIEVPVVNE